jgi:ribosomal protein L35
MSQVWLRALARLAPSPSPSLAGGVARWFSNKLSSAAKKRFRGTGRGVIKRKSQGMRHNTGMKRPGVQARKRGTRELVGTPSIVRKIKRMIGAK